MLASVRQIIFLITATSLLVIFELWGSASLAAEISLTLNITAALNFDEEKVGTSQVFIEHGPSDDNFGNACSDEMEVLGKSAIVITGSIADGDAKSLRRVLEESEPGGECGLSVIINSDGGDLDEAKALGRMLRSKPRYIFVPSGGYCLSACVFVLMAARYDTPSANVSLAMAYSDSTVGMHWPFLEFQEKLGVSEFQRLANVEPGLLFQRVGGYWTEVSDYILSMTGTAYYADALFRTLSLPGDELYLINSPIERNLAGIATAFVPGENDELAFDSESLVNLCLYKLVGVGSMKVAESWGSWFRGPPGGKSPRDELFWVYFPHSNKVCFLELGERQIKQLIVEHNRRDPQHELADGGQIGNFLVDEFWVQLKLLGLSGPEMPSTLRGNLEDLRTYGAGGARSIWDIFEYFWTTNTEEVPDKTLRNDPYAKASNVCQAKNDQYSSRLRDAGFDCTSQLFVYLFGRALFKLHEHAFREGDADVISKRPPFEEASENGGLFHFQTYSTLPGSLKPGLVRISTNCGNASQVCSLQTGTMEGGRIAIRNKPEQVDVVFIVDDSSSMALEQEKIARAMVPFLDDLAHEHIDYRVCLTTTDISYYVGSPIRWGTYKGETFEKRVFYLESTTPDKARLIADTMKSLGSEWSSDEQGIAALHLMVSDFDASGCIRDNGTLVAVVISDEDERSVGGRKELSSEQYAPLEVRNQPDELIRLIKSKFPNKRFVWNSFIVIPGDTACEDAQDSQESPCFFGRTYRSLSLQTGGYVGSICQEQFFVGLSKVRLQIAGAAR